MVLASDLRVIRLTRDYPENGKPSFGLQPVFYYLSKEQARLGHEVIVISKRLGSQPRLEVLDGVTVHRVEDPFNVTALRLLRNLTTSSKKRSVIHAHATAGLFLVPFRKVFPIPMVSHVHGTSRSHYMPVKLSFGDLVYDYSPVKMAYYYERERLLWSQADRVVTVSGAIKEDLEVRYRLPSNKVRVVFNGVDTDVFHELDRPTLPSPIKTLEGKKIVLYVGHFGLRKGLIYLIQAMARVVKEHPDAVLLCIGGVPDWLGGTDYWSYLRKTIAQNGLEGKVILLDRVPHAELPVYYSLSSLFVLPSYYEAFGKVVVEAMACRRPVIASRVGGLAEVVDEGRSGLLVNYGSVDELADSILTILDDDNLAKRMGSYGRERVEADFTWRAVADRVETVYGEIAR
ncbi:MAG: glycosyltransferase family 4 protein [Thaumarchaeota archaeon]|nr:glycosyltransferase family 4 protein [Nitrososphaerota archaeon]